MTTQTACLDPRPSPRLLPASGRSTAHRMLQAAVAALLSPLRSRWRAALATAAPAPHHRLGAWDLARSDLARAQLAAMRPRPVLQVPRDAPRG